MTDKNDKNDMTDDFADKPVLLTINDLHIQGRTDEEWIDIVKGVSLSLRKGEVLGLIGESGAGKSTVGLAAMGFTPDGLRVSSGSVNFDGIELTSVPREQRRALRGSRIAYVAQSAAASFNPAHRLIHQYSEVAVQRGILSQQQAETDAVELYTKMQLPEPDSIGFRYPHQVSGGQLQRAMTAMAMSCRPDLIIFDEPTTALDVTTQIEVLSSIRDIVEQFDTSAIYITHDLAVVAQMADRIKVLLRGEEVEEADTVTMLQSPQMEYTKSLWSVRKFVATPSEAKLTDEPLLRLENITASYDGKTNVLKSVSIDFPKACTVAVVGESGSGKSTTARVISGLLQSSSGGVYVNGESIPAKLKSRSKDQLRKIQMIYQSADTALNPKLRIRDIIGRPVAFYHGIQGKQLLDRVRELMHLIEMDPDEYMERLPSELSGGQKQRVGIARALAAEPEFMICDEVTSALDQIVADGILRLLDRLQQELNLTYMFITHDLAVVRAIADFVVVMKDGRVIEQGKKVEIFTPPHDPYTDLLLSSVVEMDPNWLDSVLEERKKISARMNQ